MREPTALAVSRDCRVPEVAVRGAARPRTSERVPQCPLRRHVEGCGVQMSVFPEWMDLKTAQTYICVSERTLREWIHREVAPLPAVQSDKKIFIRRTRLDQWLESDPVQRGSDMDVEQLVNDVLGSLTGAA